MCSFHAGLPIQGSNEQTDQGPVSQKVRLLFKSEGKFWNENSPGFLLILYRVLKGPMCSSLFHVLVNLACLHPNALSVPPLKHPKPTKHINDYQELISLKNISRLLPENTTVFWVHQYPLGGTHQGPQTFLEKMRKRCFILVKFQQATMKNTSIFF